MERSYIFVTYSVLLILSHHIVILSTCISFLRLHAYISVFCFHQRYTIPTHTRISHLHQKIIFGMSVGKTVDVLHYIISGSTRVTNLSCSSIFCLCPSPFDSSTYYTAMSRALSLSIMKAQQIDVPRHLRCISRCYRVPDYMYHTRYCLYQLSIVAIKSLHFDSVFEKSRRAF